MVYCFNFCAHPECEFHFTNAPPGDFLKMDRTPGCKEAASDIAQGITRYGRGDYRKMKINTADFAYWTIKEYTRPDGSKPEPDTARAEYIRMFGSIADIFVKKIGDGEITTGIDPETENLIIEFSSEGVGKGRLEIESVFKKE